MKKLLLIFFIIVLFSVFIAWKNSDSKIIISELLKKGDIKLGGLKYKVYLWGVFPVGEAIIGTEKLEEYKGQKVYHLTATAQTLKVFSKFFSNSAVLDSYVDIQEFNPIIYKQRLVLSGKEDIDREVFYDQKNNVMTIAGVRRQIMPNTQDHLSVFFNIGQMNFDQVKDMEININTNQKNYILEGSVESKEILINRKVCQIYTLKADIRRRDKNPYHKSNLIVISLKEKKNIPILIKVFSSGFFINAKLVEIK